MFFDLVEKRKSIAASDSNAVGWKDLLTARHEYSSLSDFFSKYILSVEMTSAQYNQSAPSTEPGHVLGTLIYLLSQPAHDLPSELEADFRGLLKDIAEHLLSFEWYLATVHPGIWASTMAHRQIEHLRESGDKREYGDKRKFHYRQILGLLVERGSEKLDKFGKNVVVDRVKEFLAEADKDRRLVNDDIDNENAFRMALGETIPTFQPVPGVKADRAAGETACVICYEYLPTHCFDTCGHPVMCQNCIDQARFDKRTLSSCPICRAEGKLVKRSWWGDLGRFLWRACGGSPRRE
jgi:hypothetical protein